MKTTCHITGKIQKDLKGNIYCQKVLLLRSMSYYVGYTCTITEISNNLRVDETPEYPYFCMCPSSVDVQIPATIAKDEHGNLMAGKFSLSKKQEIEEGTNITIRKVCPIIDKGPELMGKVLQYEIEKPIEEETQEPEKKKRPSLDDFDFVLNAGFKDIYDALEPAMRYFDSDPEQSCINFRLVLKLSVIEAERIVKFVTKGGLAKRIYCLHRFLDERGLIDKTMKQEFMIVKNLGDKYHHKDDYPDLNPQKDRLTFYYANREILTWLVALPENYSAFIRAREKEKARFKAEKERLDKEAKERAEAEKKALEELKKQEEADRKRLERNAKAREKRRLAREAKERELKFAAQKAEEEAKARKKEAKKRLAKIKWQKRVETVKKVLPWAGYSAATIAGGIVAGLSIPAIREGLKSTVEKVADAFVKND